MWDFIYTATEVLGYILGNLRYSNGWNTYYSAILNVVMFLLLSLHYKKPIFAYMIAFIFTIIGLIVFHIDSGIMR